jgi:hypothetical protein
MKGKTALDEAHGYDAGGNVTNIWSSTPNGVDLRYEFDAPSRITNVLSGGLAR